MSSFPLSPYPFSNEDILKYAVKPHILYRIKRYFSVIFLFLANSFIGWIIGFPWGILTGSIVGFILLGIVLLVSIKDINRWKDQTFSKIVGLIISGMVIETYEMTHFIKFLFHWKKVRFLPITLNDSIFDGSSNYGVFEETFNKDVLFLDSLSPAYQGANLEKLYSDNREVLDNYMAETRPFTDYYNHPALNHLPEKYHRAEMVRDALMDKCQMAFVGVNEEMMLYLKLKYY